MATTVGGKFEAALARIDAAIWKLRQPYSPPLDAPWFPTCHPQIPIKEVTNPHLTSTSLIGTPVKRKFPKFPFFKEGDPRKWICEIEEYFDFYEIPGRHKISESQKLNCATLHLRGRASQWFHRHIQPRIHEMSWSLFLEKLIDQFDSTELEDSNKSMVVDEENVIDDVSCEKNRDGVVFDSLENLEMENYRSDKSSKVFDELENQGKEKLIDQFGILEIEVDDAELGRKIQEDVVVEDCDVVEGENQKDDKAAVALDEKPSIVAISIDGGALKGLFSSTLLPLSNLVSVVGGHFILDNEIVMKAFGVPKSYMKLLFLMQTVAKSTVERRLCFDPGGSGPEMSSSVGKSSAAMSHSYMQGKLQGLGANHFVDATQASLILLANAKKQLVSGMELNNRFSEIRFVRLSVIKNLINGDTLSGLSSATFRYPRGKLLDIYRKQRALPVFDKIPEGIEDVPQITQSSTVVPLAFVIPDAEEGDLLGDISKGKITGGDISHSTSIEKKGPVKDGVIDFGDMSLHENTEKPLTNSVMYSASPDSDTGLLDEVDYRLAEIDRVNPARDGSGTAVLTDFFPGDGGDDHSKVGESVLTGIGHQVVGKNVVNGAGQVGNLDSIARLEESNSSITSFNVSGTLPDDLMSFDVPFDTNGQYQNRNFEVKVLEPTVPFEEMSLFYRDPQGQIQGPFSGLDIISWFDQGFFGTDLPVCPSDAPEDTPFQPLGELMPQLKLDSSSDVIQYLGEQSEPLNSFTGKLEVDTRASDLVDSFGMSDKQLTSSGSEALLNPHSQPGTEHNDSVNSGFDRLLISNSEKSAGIPSTESRSFHDFAGQDIEEVLYTGRPASKMENPLGKFADDIRELSHNHSGHQFLANEVVRPKSSNHNFPSDNDLNPLGLLWSELEAANSKRPLSSKLAKDSDHGLIMNAVGEDDSLFSSIGNPSLVRDTRPFSYRHNPSSNLLYDDTHFEQEANNHLSLEEHLLLQELQQQQQQKIQQQQHLLSRQSMHSSVPFFEQVQGSLWRQQSKDQSMPPELEHLLKLQLQEQHRIQQLQQQQQICRQEQQIQHQMQLLQQRQQQQEQEQQEQLLYEHLLHQQLHDPGFGASHVDQVLFKQRLLHELQRQAHNIPRHHEPSIEDLLQAKFGHNLHPEYHNDMLEQQQLHLGLQQEFLSSHPRHRSLLPMEQQLLLDLQQEQLQAQQFPLVSRQQLGIDKARNNSGVWSIDESGQFIRTAAGSHQAHSNRLNQLDFVQPLQGPSSYEKPSQFERNFMIHERSKRGNYETNYQPSDRMGSISAVTPGPNVNVNALAWFQGLDVQELPSQRQPVQRGQFPSRSPHQNQVSHHFSSPHLDVLENNRPEYNGQLSNSFIESHFSQLHLEAEKQKRDMEVNNTGRDPHTWASLMGSKNNSNQEFADLLHRNMAHQSSQSLSDSSSMPFENRDPSWPFSHPAADHSFNLNADTVGLADSFGDAFLYNQVEPEQQDQRIAKLESYGSMGRLASRSNSEAFFEHNQHFQNMDELEKEHLTDSLGADASAERVDSFDSKEEKMVKKQGSKDNSSKSVMNKGEIGVNQGGSSVIVQGDFLSNVTIRQGSFGSTGESPNIYKLNMGVDKMLVDNGYSGELNTHRVSGILSRGADTSLKPSSQGTGSDISGTPLTKGETPSALQSSEGGRREPAGNPLDATPTSNRKEIRLFRQTSSTTNTSDAPEASSFIDMLKSTKKMVPHEPECGIESQDGKGSNNKKKGKKGRQIDPSLLGFKVHSNRIMMGEIQRLDE